MKLSKKVAWLERRHERALNLLGEVMATLLLAENQEVFAGLPPKFHDCLAGWERRWRSVPGVGADNYDGLDDKPIAITWIV